MSAFIDRTGEKRKMNCGLEATIIRYRKAMDIDIQYEDGVIVKHKTYYSFVKGNISHKRQPNLSPTPEEAIISAIDKRINALYEATSSSPFWSEQISFAIKELKWLKSHVEKCYYITHYVKSEE